MCGIFACKPYKKSWLSNSIIKQNSRGPDQNEKMSFKDYGLAVNRLAITGDLENGAQPVSSSTGNTTCIFNGAVFNGDELIREFSLKPKSNNDAGILLELYEMVGKEFLNHIRGMFSIIICDKKNDLLLVSRDIFGIKPLFCVLTDYAVIFSSSIQAIPEEFHSSVKAFPPGNIWIDNGFKGKIQQKITLNRDMESILVDSINSHIPSEVKWGVSLSGGVDSSLICALARKLGHKFKCYTLDTGEGQDKKAAVEVAKFLGLELTSVKVQKEDIIKALPTLIKNLAIFDVQLIAGAFLTYFISKAAYEDGLKVVLFGEGADEAFGGYGKYTRLLKSGSTETHIQKLMIKDQDELWLTHNNRVDSASMATSIEARVPFQDSNIIANARQIPLKFKVDLNSRLKDKILLRAIASRYLPNSIFNRPKIAISQGTFLLDLVFSAVDEICPQHTISESDVKRYNLSTKDEKVFFSIWKSFYPNLAVNKTDMVERQLTSIIKKY